jgi:hypothetical protein
MPSNVGVSSQLIVAMEKSALVFTVFVVFIPWCLSNIIRGKLLGGYSGNSLGPRLSIWEVDRGHKFGTTRCDTRL